MKLLPLLSDFQQACGLLDKTAILHACHWLPSISSIINSAAIPSSQPEQISGQIEATQPTWHSEEDIKIPSDSISISSDSSPTQESDVKLQVLLKVFSIKKLFMMSKQEVMTFLIEVRMKYPGFHIIFNGRLEDFINNFLYDDIQVIEVVPKLCGGSPKKGVKKKGMKTQVRGHGSYTMGNRIKDVVHHGLRYAGRTLGGAFGPGGSVVGEAAGAFLSKIVGAGDYKIQSNSLMTGGPIAFNNPDRRISRESFITNISSSTTFTQQLKFSVNPFNDPFLFLDSMLYEEFELHGFIVMVKSFTSEAIASSTNLTLGKYVIATVYDVNDPDFQNTSQMENWTWSTVAKVSEDAVHGVECAKKQSLTNKLYTRNLSLPSNVDALLYDFATVYVATDLSQAAFIFGEVRVIWDITFRKQRTPPLIAVETHIQPNAVITQSNGSTANLALLKSNLVYNALTSQPRLPTVPGCGITLALNSNQWLPYLVLPDGLPVNSLVRLRSYSRFTTGLTSGFLTSGDGTYFLPYHNYSNATSSQNSVQITAAGTGLYEQVYMLVKQIPVGNASSGAPSAYISILNAAGTGACFLDDLFITVYLSGNAVDFI